MDEDLDTAAAVRDMLGPTMAAAGGRPERANIAAGVGANGDLEAELRRASERTGVPLTSARAQPEVAKRRLQAAEFDDTFSRFPNTMQFLGRGDNARLALDDRENLTEIEKAIRQHGELRAPDPIAPGVGTVLAGIAENFVQGGHMAREGMALQLADLFGVDGAQIQRRYNQAQVRSQAAAPDFETATGRGLYSGGASLARAVPGIAASIATRSPYPALASAGLQTEAEAYGKYRGRGASPLMAAVGAGGEGTVEVATEMLPMGFLVDSFGKAGLGKFLAGFAAREAPTEQVATLLQDAIDTAVANPNKTWGEYLKERPAAAYETLLATLVQSGALGAAHAVAARAAGTEQTADAQARQAEALANVMAAAGPSKLRERDPEAFAGFVQETVENTGAPAEVYVDARELQDALAQSGISVEDAAAALPSLTEQFGEALLRGGDVVFPVGEFAAGVAGSPIEQALAQHVRTSAEAFSAAESAALKDGAEGAFAQDAERTTSEQAAQSETEASSAVVRDQVLKQLQGAKRFTDDVNTAYADLVTSFYTAQATRLGTTPEKLFAQRPLNVVANGLFAESLNQQQTVETKAFRDWFGDSKVVDADGKPLVVYHGTRSSFEAFDPGRIGRGSGTPGDAFGYFFDASYDKAQGYGKFNVMPVHLSVRKPLRVDAGKHSTHGFYDFEAGEITERAKAGGHDGVIVENDAGERMFVVFNPEQIKSTGNRGTFDPNDPSILNQDAKDPKGTFTPATRTIALLAQADLSTFVHESGHLFLEELASLAAQEGAPAEIVEDMQKVLDWVGFKGTPAEWLKLPVKAPKGAPDTPNRENDHEKFARGFEAYLFEGKAPSAALSGIFSRFKSWLVSIYKKISTLDVRINDEVRGVFDRLLASEEEIKQAEAQRSYDALFKDAKEAGMTPAEWERYQALGADATEAAVTDLQRRSLRDMRWLANARSRVLRELQKDAKEKRKVVEAEVAADVARLQVYRAEDFLKSGKLELDNPTNAQRKVLDSVAGMNTKLHLGTLKEMYGDGPAAPWRYLSTGTRGLAASEGIHPDVAADILGYGSGDELVRALLAAPPRAETIEGMTDQRMLERYGDLADETQIQRAVDAALHNDARARMVATEVAALDKATGKPRVLMAAAKRYAKDMIARKKVRDIRPAQFTAAETRAAREAVKEKDVALRAAAKRNQLLNHYAAREAHEAQAAVEKGVDYLRKFEKDSVRGSLDVEYVDQVDALLERYDLRKSTSGADIARRESLARWVESQREIGVEPEIPQHLLDGIDRRSYKELTYDEFRGLVDTVKQIEHLGRLKHKLLTAKAQREFAAVRDEIVASINEHAGDRVANARTSYTALGAWFESLRNFWAQHIKAGTLARVMDGGKDGGPMWEYLIRSANDAGNRETEWRAKATRELSALVKPVLAEGSLGGKGTYYPTIDRSLNRESRLAIALNWGNESNRQRLLGGEGWTAQQLAPVLESMSPAEWQFVQKVWDYFEGWRPEIAAKERRVYGKEPDWIDPAPFTMNIGGQRVDMRGGYYPVKYDPRASQKAETHADAEEAARMLKAAFTSATTRRSFTKSRAEEVVGRPLLYSLDGVYNGVQEIIHDLSWHEWLIDANRIVRNPAIDSTIRTTYGPEVQQQFKRWLEDVARGEAPARQAGEQALGWIRQGVSVSGLGLNVMTAMMQPLGLSQSIVRVGPTWIARGVAKAIAAPIETSAEIASRSVFMRTRFLTQMREINELRNQVKGQTTARKWADASAYSLMLWAQRMVDVPTWWGAYEKAISEGNDETRAAALADQAVIDAQGSGMTKDLSAIERGGPALKLFTTFYSFFNTTFNLGVQVTMTEKSKAKLAANYLLLFTVPAILGTLIKDAFTPGGGDDEDMTEKLIAGQVSYLFGLMFGLRELGTPIANMIEGKPWAANYSGPAGLRPIGDAIKLSSEASQGEADDGLRKAIVNLAGELLRLPAAQVNRTITGAQALADDKTDNPLALLFGYQEP